MSYHVMKYDGVVLKFWIMSPEKTTTLKFQNSDQPVDDGDGLRDVKVLNYNFIHFFNSQNSLLVC